MKSPKFSNLVTYVVAAVGLVSIALPSAMAATVTPSPTFNVTVSLTSVCTVAATANLNFGIYTAFGSASIPAPTTNVAVTCTRSLAAAPTLAFVGGTTGLITGLNYTLAAGLATTVAGTAATGVAGSGTADVHTITITGGMPAGQAGTNSVGVQTDIRTMTVTY